MLQLILGGARSGKSRLAEQTAKESGLSVVYIATAQALDEEMQQRIQHHQQQRPSHWQLCEEPIFLADQLLELDQENQLILVDCLTLWLTNLLLAEDTALQRSIVAKTGFTVEISDEPFMGGIKATIPAKNILIDNSFLSAYEKLKKEFKFDGGLSHE